MPFPQCITEGCATNIVIPNAPQKAGSYGELVDRSLADLRRILVSEHLRLLQGTGIVGANPHEVAAALQKSAVPAVQTVVPNNARIERKNAEIQTQVDWAWPPIQRAILPAVGEEPKDEQECIDLEQTVAAETNKAVKYDDEVLEKQPTTGIEHLQQHCRKSTVQRYQERKQKTVEAEELADMNYGWERFVAQVRRDPARFVDIIMSGVIVLNAAAIAASCDTKDWKTGWLIVDTVFAVIFFLEVLVKIRLNTFKVYYYGKDWKWGWYESILVVVSIAEIISTVFLQTDNPAGSSIFRVFRLVRLSKLARIARVPMATELVMMINGAIGGAVTLFWALVLLSFPIFLVALVLRETLGEESGVGFGAESFNTLGISIFSMFRCLVAGDCADETGRPIFVLVTSQYGWGYGVIYSIALVLMQFGLFNVIIAMFVEQTVEAAKSNDLLQRRKRLADYQMFQEKSMEMAELAYSLKKKIPLESVASQLNLEEIGELQLAREEFHTLCAHPEFKSLLSTLDVAEEDHLDLFDTLDVDGGGSLDLGEIVSGISKLRGDARKSDIVAVILIAKHLNKTLADFRDATKLEMDSQKGQLMVLERMMKPIYQMLGR